MSRHNDIEVADLVVYIKRGPTGYPNPVIGIVLKLNPKTYRVKLFPGGEQNVPIAKIRKLIGHLLLLSYSDEELSAKIAEANALLY